MEQTNPNSTNFLYQFLFSDYLKHKDCFTFIQKDWETCQREFNNVLKESVPKHSKNAQYLEYCWLVKLFPKIYQNLELFYP